MRTESGKKVKLWEIVNKIFRHEKILREERERTKIEGLWWGRNLYASLMAKN